MHPTLFTLPGGFPIPTYGVVMALGCIMGCLIFALLVKSRGHSFKEGFDTVLTPILAGMIGAKLGGIAFRPEVSLESWRAILSSGGVFYIGLLTGIATAIWKMRSLGIGLIPALDCAAVAAAAGHGIGRLACLFAGCCYGGACELPWAVTYTNEWVHRRTHVPLNTPLHPAPLYESMGELTLAALLAVVLLKHSRFPGFTALLYLVGYAALRFLVEFSRGDDRLGIGVLSTSQAIAAVLMLVFGTVLAVSLRLGRLPLLRWKDKAKKT